MILNGHKDNLPVGWKKILEDAGSLIEKIEDPGLYLGCSREAGSTIVPNKDGQGVTPINYIVYSMEDYLKAILKRYIVSWRRRSC